jgi:hypothetical protein
MRVTLAIFFYHLLGDTPKSTAAAAFFNYAVFFVFF